MMIYTMNTLATPTLLFKDSHSQDHVLTIRVTLLDTSAQFSSIWRSETKTPNNLTEPTV